MKISIALLEEWYRESYAEAAFDISGSGVEDFSFAEFRKLICLTMEDLDRVHLHDFYAYGCPEIREAIAHRWGTGDPGMTMALNGASEALFLACFALLAPGDEVIVLDPCYYAHRQLAALIGCDIKTWRLHYENDFRPDLDEFRRLLSPRTKMVILNFPHNPTGISLTRQEQSTLVDLIADSGAYLLWDAALTELTYDRPPLPDPLLVYNKTISVGTFSKPLGLQGLRFGWCIAAPDILKQCVQVRDYTTLALSPVVEMLACRAIDKADELIGMRLAQARRNLAYLLRWLEEHRAWIEWVPPMGGVTIFPKLPKIDDIEAFCRNLERDHGVLLVPGTCFNYPKHVRLGFGGATDILKTGLTKFSRALIESETGARTFAISSQS